MSQLNKNKVILQGIDRTFRADLLFLMYERSSKWNVPNQLVAASYVGAPDAALAISTGLIEKRTITCNQSDYEIKQEKFRRIDKKIGIGDLVHSIVYNKLSSIHGIIEPDSADVITTSYIIAPDGNIRDALADHMISRFGLPDEWKDEYYFLFEHLIKELEVEMTYEIDFPWKGIRGVKLVTSEREVLRLVREALQEQILTIPPSDIYGTYHPKWTLKEYMINNNEAMAEKLAQFKPRHTLDDPLLPAIGMMNRVPFPSQAHMIQGLYNTLQVEDSVICSSDMG